MTQDHIERMYKMSFTGVYPLYIAKVERKGKTKTEVDLIIQWLTGYSNEALQKQNLKETSFVEFFANAPLIHPNASKITGLICGYKVEEITDNLVQKVRYLDKLIDELAKGRTMDKILRK
jgi:hypothetical protein